MVLICISLMLSERSFFFICLKMSRAGRVGDLKAEIMAFLNIYYPLKIKIKINIRFIINSNKLKKKTNLLSILKC